MSFAPSEGRRRRQASCVRLVRAAAVISVLACVGAAEPLEARVVRLVVETKRPFQSGRSFDAVGPFEELVGTVYMEIDPSEPLNIGIVNVDRAPRNRKGLVEFSAPFYIVKPVDMSRGNRKIFYGINNRGSNVEFRYATYPGPSGLPFPSVQPALSADPGDGLIFRLGFTYVDAGWAGDIATTPDRLGAKLPVAVQRDGTPIVAPVRIEYRRSSTTSAREFTLPLKGNAQFRTYESASTQTTQSTLTVRATRNAPKQAVAADQWAFGRCPAGKQSLVPTSFDLCLFAGFEPGATYELIYPAKNPTVMGLGYAVTRDLASFLRYAARDDAGNVNPLKEQDRSDEIRRVYGFGSSSTGMYLREFLYLGFNEDESHRKVFDAVRIADPGTHRLFLNVEFADPNVYAAQDSHSDFLAHSIPPLTFGISLDPITGRRDGLLKRPATDPLVIQVDSANEFWNMNASLNVHDGRGRPVMLPDTVRLYFMAGQSHTGASGVGALPTERAACAYPVNGARSMNMALRALIVALDEWADKGVAPPKSLYPDVRTGTLVKREEAERAFPKIPGVTFPPALNPLFRFDYGSSFSSTGGRLTKLPPSRGEQYDVRVPKPDSDGLDLGGLRTVDLAVPVGTNVGWNLHAEAGRHDEVCGLSGSFLPFEKTRSARLSSGDPRPSLEERYTDHPGFVSAVAQAAAQLVGQRLLLDEDLKTVVRQAEESMILR